MAENNNPIITTAKLMLALEKEIAEIRSGTMPIEMARELGKFRDKQIKVAQMEIAWQRLQRNQMKVVAKDRNLLTGQIIVEPERTEEKKE